MMQNRQRGDEFYCVFGSDEKSAEYIKKLIDERNFVGARNTDVIFEGESTPTRTDVLRIKLDGGPVSIQGTVGVKDGSMQMISMMPVGEPIPDCPSARVKEGYDFWTNLVEANVNGTFVKELPEVVDFEKDDVDEIYSDGPEINFSFANFLEKKAGTPFLYEADYNLVAFAYRCQFQEQKGFSFEGQKALDWLAKTQQEPEYDENGQVKPIHFDLTKLVSYFPEDEMPDFASFTSPVSNVEEVTAFDIPMYRMQITICNHDDCKVCATLYVRADLLDRKPVDGDNLQGVLWLQGSMVDDLEERAMSSMGSRGRMAYDFINAVKSFPYTKGFDDMMPILEPLTEIRINEGYVLDGFYCGRDTKNFYVKPYVCAEGSEWEYSPEMVDGAVTPAWDDRMFIGHPTEEDLVKGLPPVTDYVECEFTYDAIWQAYLLRNLEHFVPRVGDAAKGTWRMIYSEWFLPVDGYYGMVKDFIGDERMHPSVTLQRDAATIRCPYWNESTGLFLECVTAVKDCAGLKFSQPVIHVLRSLTE